MRYANKKADRITATSLSNQPKNHFLLNRSLIYPINISNKTKIKTSPKNSLHFCHIEIGFFVSLVRYTVFVIVSV